MRRFNQIRFAGLQQALTSVLALKLNMQTCRRVRETTNRLRSFHRRMLKNVAIDSATPGSKPAGTTLASSPQSRASEKNQAIDRAFAINIWFTDRLAEANISSDRATEMSIEHPENSTSPATAVTSTGAQLEPTRLGGDPPISVDKSPLRLGAALGALGVVVQIVMDRLHPHGVDPNDSAAAFREYATSDIWTEVHIGQFTGTLFIVLGLIALGRSLARQSGFPGALGTVSTVTAVLIAAVFAVQMAVDGVALKAAIDAWIGAVNPTERAAAFQVAESVRWTEKGLGGFFQIIQGVTLLTLGLSMALGRRYPRWLGWIGVLAGIAIAAGGTVTAHTGFSAQAGLILLLGTLLLAVFLVGAFISMWRRSAAR
jgi:hypothetical protein